MDSTGVVALFRREMVDETAPFLWSDEDVYGYLDDAQKMFTRLTGGIPDASSRITRIDFSVDQPNVKLSPLILKVRSAYRVSDGTPVRIVNYENMEREGLRFDGRTGPLRVLVIGADSKLAYFVPVPSIADAIQMLVDRMPLITITADDEPQPLEVDEHHHRHLLDHMKSLAYGKQDAETFDKTKADEFATKFQAYCGLAEKEIGRRKHKPRAVAYGGINFATQSDDYR
jgi:hypothetical protein